MKEISFMEETIKHSLPIWDRCADTPFVQELCAGTLPFEKFRQYMIQDSIYLKNYARIYGKAIYHSTVLKDIQVYYEMLGFVTDAESAVRLRYLRQFGMTDDDIELIEPFAENREYIEFLTETAERGDTCEMLMAVLPCMLSYSYIFRKIADRAKRNRSKYLDFIMDYADSRYETECREWSRFADEKCGHLPEEAKERLRSAFEKAGVLELRFWEMAYREHKHIWKFLGERLKK